MMEIHGVASPKTLEKKLLKFGHGIFPNGDGPDSYALGQQSFNGNREPSYEQGVVMGKRIVELGLFGYCHFNRSIEKDPKGEGDIRKAKFNALRGLRDGINAVE